MESSVDEDELYNAFSSVQRNVQLGKKFRYQRNVVNFMSASVLAKRPEKSAGIRKDLLRATQNKRQTGGSRLRKIGDALVHQKEYRQALVFYQLSADAPQSLLDQLVVSNIADATVCLMNLCHRVVDEKRETESYVRHNILPQLYMMRAKTDECAGRASFRVTCKAMCNFSLATVLMKFKEHSTAERTAREGLEMMISTFPLESERLKYRVYGQLLQVVGASCISLWKLDDAKKALVESLRAMKYATDFPSEEYRGHFTEVSVEMIENIPRPRGLPTVEDLMKILAEVTEQSKKSD